MRHIAYRVSIAKTPQAEMNRKGRYHFILLLALMAFADAQSHSCPSITINDLGSSTEFSTEGLIARAIVPPGDGTVSSVPVRIRNFAIVCDAAGDQINTSSYVSVVVEFQCNFQSAISSLTVCNDSNAIVTRQYQFQCIEQNGKFVWNTIVSGSSMFIQTLNPTADLSTPLADQCRRCINDQQSSRADPITHCDREFSIDHTLFLLIMIFMCPQHVQLHDVIRDKDVAILGNQLMYAVTIIFRITV